MTLLLFILSDPALRLGAMTGCSLAIGVWAVGHQLFGREG